MLADISCANDSIYHPFLQVDAADSSPQDMKCAQIVTFSLACEHRIRFHEKSLFPLLEKMFRSRKSRSIKIATSEKKLMERKWSLAQVGLQLHVKSSKATDHWIGKLMIAVKIGLKTEFFFICLVEIRCWLGVFTKLKLFLSSVDREIYDTLRDGFVVNDSRWI